MGVCVCIHQPAPSWAAIRKVTPEPDLLEQYFRLPDLPTCGRSHASENTQSNLGFAALGTCEARKAVSEAIDLLTKSSQPILAIDADIDLASRIFIPASFPRRSLVEPVLSRAF